MNISEEEFDRLSLQERSVLFLTNAAYQVLQYVRAGYVQVKVDVAFANPDGLVVYSYNQDSEVNQYLVSPDGVPRVIDSPEKENTDSDELLQDVSKDTINRVFRKWEAEETEGYPRTMLSNVEYIGQFDSGVKAYAVAIGYSGGITNKEVFQYLFKALIRATDATVIRERLKTPEDIEANSVNPAAVMKDAAIRLLSSRFYGAETDPRKDELYETLCLLSSAPYEKSQNKGRLGIATPSVFKTDAMIQFTDPIEINKENVRVIRKLMELSDRRNTILIADKGQVIGVYSVPDFRGKYSGTGVIFRGYGKWDLFSDKTGSIMSFDSVTISLTNQSLVQRVKDGFKWAGITKYDEKKILAIVDQARWQAHGTTIIVTDHAESESIRLEKANRAIGINPVGVDEKTILPLSAIDGAMMIDPNGICYAIGAILDGATVKTGNIARGARYNSAITYVDYWAAGKGKEKIKAVAIIVSSDDTVDVYPMEKKG